MCWDLWFHEAARLTSLLGAEILFYPTAIGWHPSEKDSKGESQCSAWQTIQRSHAISNGCYVAAVNRTGHENPAGGDGIEFWGQSFVAAPTGQVLAKGSADKNETIMVEINMAEIEKSRTEWPFFRDRRIDAYEGLSQRFLD